jgi:DNA-binding beta-propeller fold protein YncE
MKRVVACAVAGVIVVAASATAAPVGSLTFVDNYGGAQTSSTTSFEPSPDGKFAYLASYADDRIQLFSRNKTTGVMTPVESYDTDDFPTMLSPNGLAVSPDGSSVYVSAENSDTVHEFEREPDGTLDADETYTDGDPPVDFMAGPWDVEVSPDGENVYVIGNDDDGVVVFGRNEANGDLQFIEAERDDNNNISFMNGPEGLAVSPDGRNVYVAAQDDSTIVVFDRNQQTGVLNENEEQLGDDNMLGLEDLAVSPNGKLLAVAVNFDDAVLLYRRAADGSISQLDTIVSTPNAPLSTANDVAWSADSKTIYVAAAAADVVSQLGVANNQLSFKRAVERDELQSVDHVSLTPDYRHLLTTGDDFGNVFSIAPALELKGRKNQGGQKIKLKVETTEDCRVTLGGRKLKKVAKNVDAVTTVRFQVGLKGPNPDEKKNFAVRGKAKCGSRSDGDRFKVKFG